jgi:UDP-N-acetylglucosamine/UDP-N-acetylgalactosamine diphosphorylase
MSSLTVPKASDDERVGVFAIVGGELRVIEYTNLPKELAGARNPDGSRMFDAANIAVHLLSRTFVEDLTKDGSGVALPWHRAHKAVPFVDPSTGRHVQPDRPNAVKFEMFVFDALPLADKPLLLQARRGEVFSPVKNDTGVDSPQTARRDLIRRSASWLEQCGVQIPRALDGQPDCTLEISPLAALDAEQLRQFLGDDPPIISGGAQFYLPGQ